MVARVASTSRVANSARVCSSHSAIISASVILQILICLLSSGSSYADRIVIAYRLLFIDMHSIEAVNISYYLAGNSLPRLKQRSSQTVFGRLYMRLLRGVLFIVVAGWAASVFSQTTGQLAGLVQDARGALLA